MSQTDTPSLACRLLRQLAGGAVCTTAEPGRNGGWQVGELESVLAWLARRGVVIANDEGGGIRLPRPVDMLDAGRILDSLPARSRGLVEEVVLLDQVDSTNSWLLKDRWPEPGRGRACLAEWQSAGRGRRGRAWEAPLGGSLCLSLGWHFPALPADPGCLSLASGLAVARALEQLGVSGIGLKWPNDLLWQDRKLGGILVETRSSGAGGYYAVVGLGLNVSLGEAVDTIRSGWGGIPADLAEAAGVAPRRNALATAVLEQLAVVLTQFQSCGFAPMRGEWERRDCIRGRGVRVTGEEGDIVGVAMGVDQRGALSLQVDGRLIHCLSGDVSVRPENAFVD